MPLLNGLSPELFMRRHWQKKPLLIRGATEGAAPLTRSELFALAARDDVESRLIERHGRRWSLRHGPFARRQLPPLAQRAWTLLVQGVDLHSQAAHHLLSRFRFVPDARLDDVMVSYASDGGGVGPHVDSYDVFLLQVKGRRRWRIGRLDRPQLQPGVPLKILTNFVAEDEWVLEPGDMLYLPPQWAHDGVAEGECMTCSIGFRSASRGETAREVLQRLIDAVEPDERRYADPKQMPVLSPAQVPAALQGFARDAVARLAADTRALDVALGEWLSEPKPQVWFDEGGRVAPGDAVRLDRRTRMLYDATHVFINGESVRASGRDAALMRRLADWRGLSADDTRRCSDAALALLDEWAGAGWLRADYEGVAS